MIDPNHIPDELRHRKQWLIWRFEQGKKKPLKVPYWINGKKRYGNQGDENDRAKLADLDSAILAAVAGDYTGVGFAFLPDDGLIGIDIDKCIDADGVVSPLAAEVIPMVNSYTEYSPSGTGVHIIVSGHTETFKDNGIGLEVFCSSQFFTFTGKHYGGMPDQVNPIAAAALDRLRELVKGKRNRPAKPIDAPVSDTDAAARLESALAFIKADSHDVWIRIGMALFSALGDGGFRIWDYWSSKADNYGGTEECSKRWKSFGARGSLITEGTIFRLAMDAGWRPPKDDAGRTGVPLARAKPKPIADESPPPPKSIDQSGGEAPEGERAAEQGEVAEPPAGWDDAAPPAPEGGGGKKGKAKKVRPPEFFDTVEYLVDNFVLLYGTSTAWDRANRLQIKINDLRLAYGNDEVKWWLGNGGRHMINSKNLVFDPTRRVDGDDDYVNMFDGFKVEPKEGDCSKILSLLSHLCGGEQELVDWILKWTAYPLQHSGAKMASSIIMHGDEGSGKNLFWEKVVRQLYGEHAGVIGNAQIEAPFNEWASQKLFMVCDEVVTRNELRQLKGKLKGIISGDEIRINPKNLPERSEANHINLVFLSNELQPIALDKTDRRYLVIWTPPKQSEDYYKAVAAEVENGGAEAFYFHLLNNVDCSDFGPHTKPLNTKAKQNLISLGLSQPEKFYREWSKGGLPLPFLSCSAQQLYAAFLRWSHLNGERFPPSQTFFGGYVERASAGEMIRKVVKYEAGHAFKQRTVYLVGDVPEGMKLQDWVKEGSDLFETYLRKYRHVYDQSDEKFEERND